jgi:hypothetical protein
MAWRRTGQRRPVAWNPSWPEALQLRDGFCGELVSHYGREAGQAADGAKMASVAHDNLLVIGCWDRCLPGADGVIVGGVV